MYDKPMKIGNLEIKNRFVRSATYNGMGHEGHVTDKHVELYKELAVGGVGLIITGYAYVQKSGFVAEEQTGVYSDELIPGLSKIANIVHKHSKDCKIALQIGHCGRQSRSLKNTLAPSAVLEKLTNKMPKEMSTEEIGEAVEAFAQGVRRAKEAGFDAVQLHGAHGYLISEFFSPYTNKRTDEYGGSTENRFRFVEEIYKRSVELVGKNFPILIKINGVDFLEGGVTVEESKKIAEKLSKLGFAAIEVSGGMWEIIKRSKKELGWKPTFYPESRKFVGTKNEAAYNLPFAKEIKKVVDVPIIVVGGINSLDLVEQILREESADFVAFCRPMIREPDLPNRWLTGIGENSVECIYCNACLSSLLTTGLRCVKKEPEVQE
jgi:2,4-dienoyl-CoA reductase-like NADH-dependent reductase (Old Yellow Enzyme family)